VILVIGVVLIAALVVRHGGDRRTLHNLVLLSGLALGLRLLAITAIYIIATQVHAEGVWLSDEASYFLATESLMPWPWDKSLPQGLDHLGGNGYLGLTTMISQVVGVDALSFRFANATLGTIVVLLCAGLAQSFFGRGAGLIAGVAAAVWPDLVFWSATMLRDTLCSFAVVVVWWALSSANHNRRLTIACLVLLSVVLLSTLRPYLALAVAAGVGAWFCYPFVRRQRRRTLAIATASFVAVATLVAIGQTKRLDQAAHELFYRQTVTRMETLGRLYRDPPPPEQPIQLPFRPGAAIAIVDPASGWLSPGLVEDSSEPGQVTVALTDDTSRTLPIDKNVMLLQDVPIPPLQLLSWLAPSVLAVLVGLPTTGDVPNLVWVADALAWDALLVVAVLGLKGAGLGLRHWIYPACVIVGTMASLFAIPGSPGNAERHRATQTVPLLLVLASGVVSARSRATSLAGRAASKGSSMPISATTAVASSRRSAR
jgi:hypothetical protein